MILRRQGGGDEAYYTYVGKLTTMPTKVALDLKWNYSDQLEYGRSARLELKYWESAVTSGPSQIGFAKA
jgi:hypothetical protein